jgi:hypothetical protein
MTASRITLADVVLAVVLAVFGACLAGLDRPSSPGARVALKAPGKAIEILDLSEARTVHVAGLVGETVIAIAGGRVSFVSSPCPHKVCVRRGEISRCGEWIACVPNGVVATITGERPYDHITP